MPNVELCQPGTHSYTGSSAAIPLTVAGMPATSCPSDRWPTQTGIFSISSRTSSLVTTRLSKPLIMAAYCISGTSNQPQRRGRPVTEPNSLPRLRIWSPQESKASVGNGPPPTRVMEAFDTPMTLWMRVGGTPVPVQAPPAEALEEVTNG